jgi:hypothetical protein
LAQFLIKRKEKEKKKRKPIARLFTYEERNDEQATY